MPSATATVFYPAEDDAKFDMKYYIDKHMPFVLDTWKGEGMTGYEVVQVGEALGGSKPPYSVICKLNWKSLDDAKKALASESAKPIFDDVPNFSNKGPTLLLGDVTGSA